MSAVKTASWMEVEAIPDVLGTEQIVVETLLQTPHLQFIKVVDNPESSLHIRVRMKPGIATLWFKHDGTCIIKSGSDSQWTIFTAGSICVLPIDTDFRAQIGRRCQISYAILWDISSTPSIEALQCTLLDRFRIASTTPHFERAVALLEKAIVAEPSIQQMLIYACIYESMAQFATSYDSHLLTPMPRDLPSGFEDLVASVRENPQDSWPLKEAADMVGYSPFHFSRVFKSIVGYGFHQFVDRARTEMAIGMLTRTSSSIEKVATASGFGTAQALRESVKDYLGLVPSELRGEIE